MRRLLLSTLVALAAVFTLLGLLPTAYAQEPDGSASDQSVQNPSDTAGTEDVNISAIYCYQPDPAQDACYVNFRRMEAIGFTEDLVITLTLGPAPISPDHPVVASYEGFFEDSIIVTHDMNGPGFRVPCGEAAVPGAEMGQAYTIGFIAGQGDGTTLTNVDTLTCPAYIPGTPTAITGNSFSATLERLSRHQAAFVALAVAAGVLTNLLVPAGFRRWRKRTE